MCKLTIKHNHPLHYPRNQESILFINKTPALPRNLRSHKILQENQLQRIRESRAFYQKLVDQTRVHLTSLMKATPFRQLAQPNTKVIQKLIISQPLAKKLNVIRNDLDHKSEFQQSINCWSQFKK